MNTRSKRIFRIETRMVSRTSEIAEFLRFATVAELWRVTPPMWHALPDNLKADYSVISSTDGLRCLYAGTEDSIRPMLALLLQHWERVDPAKVAEVLAECRSFILYHRARAGIISDTIT